MPTFANIEIVSPTEANDLLVECAVAIVDVRTPCEYERGHIEGALNLPINDLNEETIVNCVPFKDSTVLLYCRSGLRSYIASGMLVQMGYSGVHALMGGLDAWPFGTVR